MSHESIGKSDEWYTPAYIFKALNTRFDLDVAHPEIETHVPANNIITENSLASEWFGYVWMNPPFGGRNGILPWVEKFINHKNGIMLTPDRTSCGWWQNAAKETCAVLFLDGKVKFIKPDGSVGAQPSNGTTLFGIGEKAIQDLKIAESNGLGKLYINT